MGAIIVRLFTGKGLPIAIAALCIVLALVQLGRQKRTINALRGEVATLTAEREQCLGSVEVQNKAVDEMKRRADEAIKRVELAQQDAAKIGVEVERRVRRALTTQVPTECPAAMDWLAAEGGAVAKEWTR